MISLELGHQSLGVTSSGVSLTFLPDLKAKSNADSVLIDVGHSENRKRFTDAREKLVQLSIFKISELLVGTSYTVVAGLD